MVFIDDYYIGIHLNLCILWELSTGKRVRTYKEHTKDVFSLVLTKDRKGFISSGEDGLCIHWDIMTGNIISTYNIGHTLNYVVLHPDGDKFVVCDSYGTHFVIYLKHPNKYEVIHTHSGSTRALTIHPDGLSLFAGFSRWVDIIDIKTGEKTMSYIYDSNTACSFCIHPNGKYILIGYDNGYCVMWDIIFGYIVKKYKCHDDDINAIRIDGNTFTTCCHDCTIATWNIDTGKCLYKVEYDSGTDYTQEFHPDRTFVAVNNELILDISYEDITEYLVKHLPNVLIKIIDEYRVYKFNTVCRLEY